MTFLWVDFFFTNYYRVIIQTIGRKRKLYFDTEGHLRTKGWRSVLRKIVFHVMRCLYQVLIISSTLYKNILVSSWYLAGTGLRTPLVNVFTLRNTHCLKTDGWYHWLKTARKTSSKSWDCSSCCRVCSMHTHIFKHAQADSMNGLVHHYMQSFIFEQYRRNDDGSTQGAPYGVL